MPSAGNPQEEVTAENLQEEVTAGNPQTEKEGAPKPRGRWRHILRAALAWLPFAVWLALFGTVPYAGRFPTGDSPHILGICMRLGWYLRTMQLDLFFDRWLGLLAPHPPGAYLLPSLLYATLGIKWYVPWLAGAILLTLLWDAVLRMLRATGARGAWGVALTLAAAPLIWAQAEVQGIDLASAAAVAQCLSHLMVSRGLSNRKAAILAGFWLGIGFWTKYTFPVFLFVPCLLVLIGLVWDMACRRPGIRARIRNGLYLVGSSFVTLLPLMVLKGKDIINYVHRSLYPTAEEKALIDALAGPGSLDISSFEKRFFYLAAFKDLWGWPGMALLCLGLLVLLATGFRAWVRNRRGARAPVLCDGPGVHGGAARGGERTRHAVSPPGSEAIAMTMPPDPGPTAMSEPAVNLGAALLGLSCAVAGVLILSTFAQKVDRYMLPMLFPLVAVLIPPLSGRSLFAPLVLAVMLPPLYFVFADYAGYTQHLPFDRGVREVHVNFHTRGAAPNIRRLDHPARQNLTTWGRYPLPEEAYRPYSADPRRWKIDTVLERLATLPGNRDGWAGVYISPSLPATHLGLFLMRAERLGYHWSFVTVKLRPPDRQGVRADLFQAPFVEREEPSFNVMVVLDNPGDADRTGLLERYLKTEGFQEDERFELGHGRVRILERE